MTDFSKSARRITFVLFVTQCLVSAGNIASTTVNPIVGAKLGGSDYWTGVPTAVYLLGSALAASAWGYIMDAIGRRNGIVLGLLAGMIGNALIWFAIRNGSIQMLLIGMALVGATNAAVVLGRFAAGEVNAPDKRGGAISMVVWGGTFGAVFGPLLVGPMGNFVKTFGYDELAGAYLAAFILLAGVSVILFFGLRPDPRELGKQIAEFYPSTAPVGQSRSLSEIFRQPAAMIAVTAMVLGQMVMVAIMVITSRHMNHHQHGLNDIARVIQAHTIGMYAFSIISGRLSDKWGRGPVIFSGAVMLLLACVSAPLSPDVLPLSISLFFLGLGWNFCFVGGSALLADQLSPLERSRTQGTNDLLVGLASATGSLSSGIVFAATSYMVIPIVAGVLSLVPLVISLLWTRRKTIPAVA
ncbi:MAG TPA: MFS transporter [Anaerolineales bacterium]